MDAGLSSTRQARAQHRHELRTLTYVTLDQANGGIVRNLSHKGIGLQVVAAVRPPQQLRVRFELRYPRLQVEARAEVVWATTSGQCGIRFLDMSPVLKRQINEWILGNLLEGISLHTEHSPVFTHPHRNVNQAQRVSGPRSIEPQTEELEEEDGLMVSAMPVKVIELPARREPPVAPRAAERPFAEPEPHAASELDWLSQPLSGRALAWTVDTLVVVAAVLLFTLVFLSVTREAPRWPLAWVTAAACIIAGMYWGFFRLFAGGSLGVKLARIAESDTLKSEVREETFR